MHRLSSKKSWMRRTLATLSRFAILWVAQSHDENRRRSKAFASCLAEIPLVWGVRAIDDSIRSCRASAAGDANSLTRGLTEAYN
jgi:hypothetical protein